MTHHIYSYILYFYIKKELKYCIIEACCASNFLIQQASTDVNLVNSMAYIPSESQLKADVLDGDSSGNG